MGSLLEFMRCLQIGERMQVRQTKFGIAVTLSISPNHLEYIFDTIETSQESHIVKTLEKGISKLRKNANG